MTTRFRDFGSGDAGEKQPLSFKLYDEEFICVTAIQGKLLLDLVADSSTEDPVKNAAIVEKFFMNVLADESHERFQALLTDKEKIVSMDTLANITSWLVEEYTDRPTQGPEVS